MAGMDADVVLVHHQQNLTVRKLVILVLGLNPRTRMTSLEGRWALPDVEVWRDCIASFWWAWEWILGAGPRMTTVSGSRQ